MFHQSSVRNHNMAHVSSQLLAGSCWSVFWLGMHASGPDTKREQLSSCVQRHLRTAVPVLLQGLVLWATANEGMVGGRSAYINTTKCASAGCPMYELGLALADRSEPKEGQSYIRLYAAVRV
jgi:hypothetical protein